MGLINGLVGYWKLNEKSGNAEDSYSDHDGTVSVTTQGATGKLGTCYYFDGTDDYVSIPSHNDFNFSDGFGNDIAFSISLWVNVDATAGLWNGFVCRYDNDDSGAQWAIEYRSDINVIHCHLYENGSTTYCDFYATYTLKGAGWKHLVFTYDGSASETGVKIYIDGSSQTVGYDEIGSYTGMSSSASHNICFGRWGGTDYFTGYLDDVAIYKNKILSQAEILELYNDDDGDAYPFTRYGRIIKMDNGLVKTPHHGVLMDLETGLKYTFKREGTTGVPTEWNVKMHDIVSFTIDGSTATGVTLYKKYIQGIVYSYSS